MVNESLMRMYISKLQLQSYCFLCSMQCHENIIFQNLFLLSIGDFVFILPKHQQQANFEA